MSNSLIEYRILGEAWCCNEKIHGIKGKKKKAYGRVRTDAPSGLSCSYRRRPKVCKCLVKWKRFLWKWLNPYGPTFKHIAKNFHFFIRCFLKLLPLQGALLTAFIPRALPWAKSFCPFRACCVLQTVRVDKIPFYLHLYQRFESFLPHALPQGGFIPAQKTAAPLLA